MMPPTSIDGTDITGATIDGQDVQEITVDGDTVFSAEPQPPDPTQLDKYYDFSTYSTATLSNIPDLSGNGNDLVNGSFTSYGTINGIQAIEADADFLETGDVGSLGSFTAHFCSDLDSGTVENLLVFASGGTRHLLQMRDDTTYRILQDEFTDGTGPAFNNQRIITYRFDASSGAEIRVDGSSVVTLSETSGNTNNLGFGSGLTGGTSGATFISGLYGEVLQYDNARTSSEVEAAEDYLSNKWSVPI